MIICIPTAINQTVPQAVLDGIAAQTVPCSVVVIATPGVIDSQRHPSAERLRCESNSRNACTDYLFSEDDFGMTIDRDIVMNSNTVEKLLAEIKADEKLGALSVRVKDYTACETDIVLACTMWRLDALQRVTFPQQSFACLCLVAKQQLESAGYARRYADIEPVTELKI